MRFRHLTVADYRVMRWANGRGQTVELLRIEDAEGALQLRLSVADVAEAGAFSQLPGIDRVLTLIEGEGFDLDFGGAAPAITALPFVPVAFSGDWSTSAVDVRGPSRDFNVMTARGAFDVDVSRVAGASIAPAELVCLYVVNGSAAVTIRQPARHCGERSDEAIQKATVKSRGYLPALGMTEMEEMAVLRLQSRDLLILDRAGRIDIETSGNVLAIRLDPRSV